MQREYSITMETVIELDLPDDYMEGYETYDDWFAEHFTMLVARMLAAFLDTQKVKVI